MYMEKENKNYLFILLILIMNVKYFSFHLILNDFVCSRVWWWWWCAA